MYSSPVLVSDVPPAVVTVTSTVLAPAGAVTVREVAVFLVSPVAALVPNFAERAPLRLVPVITTDVPPTVGPELGVRPVTVGRGGGGGGVALEALSSTPTVEEVPAGDWVALGARAPDTLVS